MQSYYTAVLPVCAIYMNLSDHYILQIGIWNKLFLCESGIRDTITSMDRASEIIDYLAGRRRQLRISQEELGKRVGFSRNHIGKIERHATNPTFASVVRMCEALEIDINLTEKPVRNRPE